ncbi:MAG: gliding motility lipoprotein GldH [Paludibacteraceae bacterium]|nr:gliding motility lipoprotein GldH [Paludibacteraceae bacterium]
MKHLYQLILLLVVLTVATTSCSKRVPFCEVDNIADGWNKDSVYHYSINVEDTTSLYELDMVLRNDNNFPDQNLWLRIAWEGPQDTVQHIDTLNIILADEFGRWRGRGIGSNFNNIIIYQDSLRYRHSGTYEYNVTHLMRHENVQGLTQIGMQLMKKK